jgi:phage head maturation protease
MNIRTIDKVSQLYDVSSVTYPAYNQASSAVALRSLEEWKSKEENTEGIKEEDLKKRSLNEMRLKILKNKY